VTDALLPKTGMKQLKQAVKLVARTQKKEKKQQNEKERKAAIVSSELYN
jgi:hypothetical protein